MIFHAFPDINWLKKEAESRFASGKDALGNVLPQKGWPTVVLNVQAHDVHRDNIRGPLSLFSNFKGESIVEAEGRSVKVKSGQFFLTNRDQYYSLYIEKQKAETFNIHFGEAFVKQILHVTKNKPEVLLDSPTSWANTDELNFYNRLREKDETLARLLREIKTIKDNNLLLEEKLYEVLKRLITFHFEDEKIKDTIPAVKKTTKDEIIKRLMFSLDYMQSCYDEDITLETLASISCLSKFHFLRLFKIAFQQTPYQYLNQIRINKAKELLRFSNQAVNVIARETGFKDSSSFSRTFQQTTGVYPSQFRGLL